MDTYPSDMRIMKLTFFSHWEHFTLARTHLPGRMIPLYLVPQPIQWQREHQSLWAGQGSRASSPDYKSLGVWGQLDSRRHSQPNPTTTVGVLCEANLSFQSGNHKSLRLPVWVRDMLLTTRGAMTIENIQTKRLWRPGVGKLPITQNSTSHLLCRLLVYSLQMENGFLFKSLCKHLHNSLALVPSKTPPGPLCLQTFTQTNSSAL